MAYQRRHYRLEVELPEAWRAVAVVNYRLRLRLVSLQPDLLKELAELPHQRAAAQRSRQAVLLRQA